MTEIEFKAFTAFYSLTPVFQKGKGVELIPFSIGVSWMRFKKRNAERFISPVLIGILPVFYCP